MSPQKSCDFLFQIEEEGEERLIHLTEPELRKILAEQIVGLLKVQKNECVPLHHLMSAFTCHYGFNIPLHDFGVDSEEELLNKLKHVVKVAQSRITVLKYWLTEILIYDWKFKLNNIVSQEALIYDIKKFTFGSLCIKYFPNTVYRDIFTPFYFSPFCPHSQVKLRLVEH